MASYLQCLHTAVAALDGLFPRLHYYSLQSKEAKKSLLGASIRIEELVFLRRMRGLLAIKVRLLSFYLPFFHVSSGSE